VQERKAMQMVFNIIISSLTGAILVCGILLVIVQWMRLHNEKSFARDHQKAEMSDRRLQWESPAAAGEKTRFGIPVDGGTSEKDIKKDITERIGRLMETPENLLGPGTELLELTKLLAASEGKMPPTVQRMIPKLEEIALDHAYGRERGGDFPAEETARAGYYLEVIRKVLS